MSVVTEDAPPINSFVHRQRVAPWQHTVIILLVLALWAVYGALHAQSGIISDAPRWMRYTGQMLVLWLMTGTTIAGLYHRRRFLRSVAGGFSWKSEVGVGLLVFLVGVVLLGVVGVVLRPLHLTHLRNAVLSLGPHTFAELALWMLVSASAAICEEFIFRGYLLRQIMDWWGSPVLAIVLSAAIFGSMHLYEGTAPAIQIAALGALFAIVAVRRHGLRAAIIAHFLQDAVAGILLFWHH
jgi:membrane protease YdiL (CAAX protease family)